MTIVRHTFFFCTYVVFLYFVSYLKVSIYRNTGICGGGVISNCRKFAISIELSEVATNQNPRKLRCTRIKIPKVAIFWTFYRSYRRRFAPHALASPGGVCCACLDEIYSTYRNRIDSYFLFCQYRTTPLANGKNLTVNIRSQITSFFIVGVYLTRSMSPNFDARGKRRSASHFF